MQSNKIHNVLLMSKFYSALFVRSTCFGPHRSVIRSVLYKLYSQTLVCAVIRVLLDTSSRCKNYLWMKCGLAQCLCVIETISDNLRFCTNQLHIKCKFYKIQMYKHRFWQSGTKNFWQRRRNIRRQAVNAVINKIRIKMLITSLYIIHTHCIRDILSYFIRQQYFSKRISWCCHLWTQDKENCLTTPITVSDLKSYHYCPRPGRIKLTWALYSEQEVLGKKEQIFE